MTGGGGGRAACLQTDSGGNGLSAYDRLRLFFVSRVLCCVALSLQTREFRNQRRMRKSRGYCPVGWRAAAHIVVVRCKGGSCPGRCAFCLTFFFFYLCVTYATRGVRGGRNNRRKARDLCAGFPQPLQVQLRQGHRGALLRGRRPPQRGERQDRRVSVTYKKTRKIMPHKTAVCVDIRPVKEVAFPGLLNTVADKFRLPQVHSSARSKSLAVHTGKG